MESAQSISSVSSADTVLLADLPADSGGGPMPTIGQIGRYALKYRIGAGGIGTVYAADDPLLSRRVAIKTLDLMPSGGKATMETDARAPFDEMFLHEARAAAQLSHPHIVTVFDAGISATPGQGAYIAMELLKGKDLRELLAEGWRPSPGQAALIMRRAADALAYAHSKGVVHRDVKPANIFMVGRTQPKLLDFGIASIAHASDSQVAGGSPHYMSPEQVRHDPTDRRSDVFSLGAVLYELLAGRKAFDGDSVEAITESVLHGEPPALHLIAPGVPQPLADIAQRAMAKRPEDRQRSMRVLARELHEWLQATPGALQKGEEDGSAPWWREHALALGCLGTAVLVALVGGYAWSQRSPRAAATVAAAAPATAMPAATPGAAPTLVTRPPQRGADADPASFSSRATMSGSTALPVTAGVGDAAGQPTSTSPPAATAATAATDVSPDALPRSAATAVASTAPASSTAAALAPAAAPAVTVAAAQHAAVGQLQLAISPWAQVEVDGRSVGIAPPLRQLSLRAGRHTITLRNNGRKHVATIEVGAEDTAVLKYRFVP